MKAKPKGLQKLTESTPKIKEILSHKQITNSDLKGLTNDEFNFFINLIQEKLNASKDIERDDFYNKIEPIIGKNQIWENNHNQIIGTISNLMQEYNRMPTKNEISAKAGISRQTIHKHLKEYASHPMYLEQIEMFKFMTARVLAKVFVFAINGDTGAAKLYFNIVGNLSGEPLNNSFIKNQNNYIQINSIMLNQETIQHLSPEDLNKIESIIKTALPKSMEIHFK